jgi:hypothetical protein
VGLTSEGSQTLPRSRRDAAPGLDAGDLSGELYEHCEVLVMAFPEAVEPIEPITPQFVSWREETQGEGMCVQHRFVISLRRRHPHQYSHARIRKRVDLWHHEGRAPRQPRCLLAHDCDALTLLGPITCALKSGRDPRSYRRDHLPISRGHLDAARPLRHEPTVLALMGVKRARPFAL